MTRLTREELFRLADEEHMQFQRAIGGLTLAWSDTESALYAVLLHYSKVSQEVGRAIFSGARADAMIKFIRAIAHNTNMEKARLDDLDDVFGRINTIGSMRNFIVHHVSGSLQEFDDDDPTARVIEERRTSRAGNEQRVMIGSENIDAMSADLAACCWRLVAHPDIYNEPFRPHHGPNGKPHTWLYKPLSPSSPEKRSQKDAQSPPRPRKSSPPK